MTVKLLMTWNIAPENEREYFEVVIGEFIPGVQRLGLQPVEAWVTMFGSYPQIQVAMLADTLGGAQRILGSEGWGALQAKLFGFVRDYACKVVPARNGFQF